ncbi:MAG TPA: hypothetical protein VKK79_07260 [Candidatus Lokiarchaeia archaeon]|nr:hypothetical protein [Candidatus Lokiarchaeia archaeon]
MSIPPEKFPAEAAEISDEVKQIEAGDTGVVWIRDPDQLPELLPILPYAGVFINLCQFLNVIKENGEFARNREILLPRGHFLYLSPVGEDVRPCLYHIARMFDLRFLELMVSRVLTEGIASTQVLSDAIERGTKNPDKWASLLYIPDFDIFLEALQDPVQHYLLSQSLVHETSSHAPLLIVAEIHDGEKIPPAIKTQFDFFETLPPLTRDEGVALLKEIVKFDLPWDSPSLLTGSIWMNQLRKVAGRVNMLALSRISKRRKIQEKEVNKIVQECATQTKEAIKSSADVVSPHAGITGTEVETLIPKNRSFGEQILQDLASRNFAIACNVLDKLMQGEPVTSLTDPERAVLAEYSNILLSDDLAKVKVRLLNAKKRVDAIKIAFKRDENEN